jgi:outer membrane receptor protein involved in Fe transport
MSKIPAVCLTGLLLAGTGQNLLAQGVSDPLALSLDSLLNTKISSAAKYEQTSSEAASSVTIVTAEDIQRHGYRSLPEVLAAARGFYLSYDRNYSFLGARGFSRPSDYNNRVLLLVDGNAINEGVFGGAPVGTDLGVPLHSLERIEIVRGPGSALYGTGAIFAVVNLITKPADGPPALQGALRGGSYGARGGSLEYRGAIGSNTGLSLAGTWDGSDGQDLFYPEYASPETNSGIAHDMDWERRWALLGALNMRGLTLHGRYSSRTKAIPTGAYETDLVGDPSTTRDDYGFLELKFDRPLDDARQIAARAYLNTSRYDGDYITAGENASDGARNEAVGAEATLRWDIASSNRLTVGGEARRDLRARYFTPRELPRDVDISLPNTVLSAYVQDEHQITRSLSLLAGLRHDSYQTSQDATSPRLAAIFAPAQGSTFKLLYGSAFRAPGPYEAADGGEQYKENPDLRPETAQTMEAVWQQRLAPGLLGSLSLFHYDMRRLIDLTLDPVDSLYQYRNVGDARADGFELELQGRLQNGITGYLSYSYQDATERDTGARLTNSPEHMLKAGAALELTGYLGAAVDNRYESGRRTLVGTQTDAVFVSDLHLLVPARPTAARGVLQRLELSFRLNNLFDASFATPGGVEHRQAAILQDGRNLSAELRYRF